MKNLVVIVTAPDKDEAARIGKVLVEERLAACVNVVGNVRSIYRWEGQIEDDAEALMIIKTREGLFEGLSQRVKQLHEYSVPEIIALPIERGLREYLDWIGIETGESA